MCPADSYAADLLIADRLSNSVYRYSGAGDLLGTVVDHSTDLNQPTGIGMSPDFTELYVSSSQNNRVMKYAYNPATGMASSPTIFADAGDGLAFPNDIAFSPDGSQIYVANLSGGVSRFHRDGSSAGAKLLLPTSDPQVETPASSLAFAASGQLLAGAFQDAAGAGGGVAISNVGVTAFPNNLIEPQAAINGATGLMIHDGYLYVSGLFSFNIRRFTLADGQLDAAWGISGVAFPNDLIPAPDGNGFLAGILGFAGGSGNISRYAYDGTLLGTFATPSASGFTEATALVVVRPPLVGDFNNNGAVDAADYVVWREAASTATLPNDDTPGIVDASDYIDWRSNFGRSSAASSAAVAANPVPEPTGMLFAFVGLITAVRLRSQR